MCVSYRNFWLSVSFVKGNKPGHGTGFDMDDAGLLEMERCHGVVVASAIFGTDAPALLIIISLCFCFSIP